MTAITKHLDIAAPLDKVWAALTDTRSIEGWMGEGTVADLDLKVGGSYGWFGGDTTGRFTLIEKPNKLEYTWRQHAWPAAWADSVVGWELKTKGQGTDVALTHDQFPNQDERDSHAEGWDTYWLGPMKEWLEGRA